MRLKSTTNFSFRLLLFCMCICIRALQCSKSLYSFIAFSYQIVIVLYDFYLKLFFFMSNTLIHAAMNKFYGINYRASNNKNSKQAKFCEKFFYSWSSMYYISLICWLYTWRLLVVRCPVRKHSRIYVIHIHIFFLFSHQSWITKSKK